MHLTGVQQDGSMLFIRFLSHLAFHRLRLNWNGVVSSNELYTDKLQVQIILFYLTSTGLGQQFQ